MLRHTFCQAIVSIRSLQKICDVVSEGLVLIAMELSTVCPPIKHPPGWCAPHAVVSDAVLAAVYRCLITGRTSDQGLQQDSTYRSLSLLQMCEKSEIRLRNP